MGQTMPQGLDLTRPFRRGGFALMPHGVATAVRVLDILSQILGCALYDQNKLKPRVKPERSLLVANEKTLFPVDQIVITFTDWVDS
jgi:hypothetical protein